MSPSLSFLERASANKDEDEDDNNDDWLRQAVPTSVPVHKGGPTKSGFIFYTWRLTTTTTDDENNGDETKAILFCSADDEDDDRTRRRRAL